MSEDNTVTVTTVLEEQAPPMPPEICGGLISFKKSMNEAEAGVVKRGVGQVGQRKYNYATIADLFESIDSYLLDAGLALYHDLVAKSIDGRKGYEATTVIYHSSGAQHRFAPLFFPATKDDPQGIGSLATYARRYATLNALGIAPEDDDDGAAAMPQGGQQSRSTANSAKAPKAYKWDKSLTDAQAKSMRKQVWEAAQEIGHDGKSLSTFLMTEYGIESFLGEGDVPGATKAKMDEVLADVLGRKRFMNSFEALGLSDTEAFHNWFTDTAQDNGVPEEEQALHLATGESVEKIKAIGREVIEDLKG